MEWRKVGVHQVHFGISTEMRPLTIWLMKLIGWTCRCLEISRQICTTATRCLKKLFYLDWLSKIDHGIEWLVININITLRLSKCFRDHNLWNQLPDFGATSFQRSILHKSWRERTLIDLQWRKGSRSQAKCDIKCHACPQIKSKPGGTWKAVYLK